MADAQAWKEHERKRVRATIAQRVLAFDSARFDAVVGGLELEPSHLRYQLSKPELLDEQSFLCLAESILEEISEAEDPELLDDCVLLMDLVRDAESLGRGFSDYFIPAEHASNAQAVFEHLLVTFPHDGLAEALRTELEHEGMGEWSHREVLSVLTGRRRLTLPLADAIWSPVLRALDSAVVPPPVLVAFEAFSTYLDAFEAFSTYTSADAVVGSAAWQALRQESRDAWVTRLLPTFNPRIDPSVIGRAAEAHVSVRDLKRRSLEVGLALAFARALEPWTPRRDSRKAPTIPGRDLPPDELRAWLDRMARQAARDEIRGRNDASTSVIEVALQEERVSGVADLEALTTSDGKWYWQDIVSSDESDAGSKLHDDQTSDAYELEEDGAGVNPDAREVVALLFEKVQPADRDVLNLMGSSVSPAVIAQQLGRSPNAVSQSMSRIRKLAKTLREDPEQ